MTILKIIQNNVGKIIVGVLTTVFGAALVWAVPYEYNHHVKTNNTVQLVAQLGDEFHTYIQMQEYRDIMNEARKRSLTNLEESRKFDLEVKLNKTFKSNSIPTPVINRDLVK